MMAVRAWGKVLAGGVLALLAAQAAQAAQATLTQVQLGGVVAGSGTAVFDTVVGRLTITELGSTTMTGSDLFGFEGLWLGSGGSGGQYLLQFDHPLAALSLDLIALSHLPEEGTESLGSFSTDHAVGVQASSADGSAQWTGSALVPTEEDGRATLTLTAQSAAGFMQFGFVHNQPAPLSGFVVQQIRVDTLSAVPEPSTSAQWLMGALALGAWRWRARRWPGPPPGLRGAAADSVSVRSASAMAAVAGSLALGLSACGGGAGPDAQASAADEGTKSIAATGVSYLATQRDAVRLADQASFGASEALVTAIRTAGADAWVAAQLTTTGSSYSRGGDSRIDKTGDGVDPCAAVGDTCYRDYYSTEPLSWDFYRNAVGKPDQLRQRVAFALAQILVISEFEVSGTYGWRNYHNALLANAFGNYREVLRKVTLSPLMGEYLDHVNNDKAAPNENFARELLQLFALGTCQLNADGTLVGGRCQPTYDNATVRAYAFALTGWTYPAGGSSQWGCWPEGANCRFLGGDMVAKTALQDNQARSLLGGVNVPASRTPTQALGLVLDSLMNHPNMAPFVGRQLIQHLVKSNPTPAYVKRVADVFVAGRFAKGTRTFGTGTRGDLAATVAAVLLDTEARNSAPPLVAEKLREPVLMMTGVLRALNGHSDGAPLGWWWGEELRQHVFMPPSVFSFYPPNFPVAGTRLVGPAFGVYNANTAFARLNFINMLLYWGGVEADGGIPGALGTGVNLTAFRADAGDATRLVERLVALGTGGRMSSAAKARIVEAVNAWPTTDASIDWRTERVRTAAYLVFASPAYQVLN